MEISSIVDFEEPPVVETVLGVQFDRIAKLQNAHLGAFWKSLGKAWPMVRDHQPLPQEFEKFGESERIARGFKVELSNDPSARLMIGNRQKDQLIQVQNGRFHFNWIKQEGQAYPRYGAVRSGFEHEWSRFCGFIEREVDGTLKANQWEVTYVNAIPRGTVWSSASEIARAFSFMAPRIDGRCGPLEAVSAELHFEIQPQRGRLHVQLTQSPDGAGNTVAHLTLTARGPLGGNAGAQTISDGLDIGRESIVRAFASLTTDEARKFWRERNAGRGD